MIFSNESVVIIIKNKNGGFDGLIIVEGKVIFEFIFGVFIIFIVVIGIFVF